MADKEQKDETLSLQLKELMKQNEELKRQSVATSQEFQRREDRYIDALRERDAELQQEKTRKEPDDTRDRMQDLTRDVRQRSYAGKLRKFKTLSRIHPHPTEWVEEIRAYVDSFFEDDGDKCMFVQGLLEREVKNELKVRLDIVTISSGELLDELMTLYGDVKTVADLRMEFFHRTQGNSETVEEFAVAIVDLMVQVRAKDGMLFEQSDEMMKAQFAAGLTSVVLRREMKRLLQEQASLTFSQFRKRANAFDLGCGDGKVKRASCHTCIVEEGIDDTAVQASVDAGVQPVSSTRISELEKIVVDQQKIVAEQQKIVAEQQKELGKRVGDWSMRDKEGSVSVQPDQLRKCTFCGKNGHNETKCWKKHGKPGNSKRYAGSDSRTCFFCHQSGHVIAQCWQKQKWEQGQSQNMAGFVPQTPVHLQYSQQQAPSYHGGQPSSTCPSGEAIQSFASGQVFTPGAASHLNGQSPR